MKKNVKDEEPNVNFNRTYTLWLKFHKKVFDLNILFNDYNTYTGYYIKPGTHHVLKLENKLNVCFDIKKLLFCNTFLDFNDKRSDSCNIVNGFDGIYTQYKDILYYDMKETVSMGKVLIDNSFVENKIDISIIRLYKFPQDSLFCVCNRQFINDKYKRRTVRSSIFSLYTKECNNYLYSLYKKYKTDGGKFEDCTTAMESLFENKSQLTPQQKQNGFSL